MFTSRFQHLSEVVDKCRVAVAIALRVVQPQVSILLNSYGGKQNYRRDARLGLSANIEKWP